MTRVLAFLVTLSMFNVVYADGLLPPKALPVSDIKTEANTPAVTMPIQQGQIIKESPRIEATKSQIQLHSRLRKQYTGYAYTVSNNTGEQLELLHAEIVNGMNGQGAALGVQKSSAAAIGGTIGGGLVLGLVTFGITFLVALVASPVIYAVNHHANTKAIAEGMPYSNQVPSGILGAGEVIQFNTLTPLNQTPQVKMTFRNLATNEIFSVTK